MDLQAEPDRSYDTGEFEDNYSAMPPRRASGAMAGLGASAGPAGAGAAPAPELDSWGAK